MSRCSQNQPHLNTVWILYVSRRCVPGWQQLATSEEIPNSFACVALLLLQSAHKKALKAPQHSTEL